MLILCEICFWNYTAKGIRREVIREIPCISIACSLSICNLTFQFVQWYLNGSIICSATISCNIHLRLPIRYPSASVTHDVHVGGIVRVWCTRVVHVLELDI